MADCIFCKIISREIDAKRVYEDESNLAFLDINPANKGHTLVISKYHAPTIFDLPEEQAKNLMVAIKRVAVAVKDSVAPHGMNILQNNGKAAGQIVDHIHFHIIPRNIEDGNELHFQRMDIKEEDQKKIAKQIRDAVKITHEQPKKEDKVNTMLNTIDNNLKALDDILK